MTDVCGTIGYCSRNDGHSGHHGGFREMHFRPQPMPAVLTAHQFDVMRLTAMGKTYDEIAGELGNSRSTVKRTKTLVFEHLGVENAIEAFVVLGWIKVPPRDAVYTDPVVSSASLDWRDNREARRTR